MGVIFITPLICGKVHIPSIVGFILMGIAFGPHGLGWLGENSAIQILGSIGMLYIMFQAGVQIDFNEFRQYRYQALLYGLLSFICPFVIGLLTSRLLGFEWATCVLMGGMYGTHTLMTYTIVSRYGIQKNRAVNIVVGGTMVAITLALTVLTISKSHVQAATATQPALQLYGFMVLKILLFAAITIFAFPYLTQWFFKRHNEPVASFMLVMMMMIVSAFLAEWAGLEGILGAFICGVMLNRLIPNLSPLMNRITFMGNSIFVPLFLISVGMMIDISLLWKSWSTLLIAVVMIGTKLSGKFLAAWLAQRAFRLNNYERWLMLGLTHATSASTLAIVTIGYQVGLFNAEILNAAVLMILVLCTSASFITEYAAKQLALQEEAHLECERTEEHWLLMSVGENMHNELKQLANLSDLHQTEIIQSSDWQDANTLIEHTGKSAAIYHEVQPLSTVNRLLVAVPRYAEKEHDFISCFGQIRRLSSEIGAKVIFFANEDTQRALQAMCRRKGKFLRASYREMTDWEDVLMMAKEMTKDDMIVMVSSRHATASYNPLFEQIPSMLERFFATNNYMVIYPEQQTGSEVPDVFLTDMPQSGRTWRIITKSKQWVLAMVHRFQTGK